jgi:hypothetical protein
MIMKNIFKFLAIVLFVGTFVSCDEDLIIFDAENGQTAISFAATSFNLSIPTEGLTVDVPVQSTTSSTSDRNFNVIVDSATGGSGEYTIGTVSIPANSFLGTLSVVFNFDAIDGPDGEVKDLVISLDLPEGAAAYDDVVSFSYFREIVCNDLELTVVSDIFGTETSYEITDAQGNVVAGDQNTALFGGNFCTQLTYSESINLPDGDYTLTVFDAFGDGQVAQNDGCGPDDIVGSYSLTCSIIVHAQGSVSGFGDVINFTVNP